MSLIQRAQQSGVKPSVGQQQGTQNKMPDVMRTGLSGKFLGGLADFATGALKGIGSTVSNIGELGARAMSPIDKALGIAPVKSGDTEKALGNLGVQNSFTPTNLGQKIGFGAEQIGEFFVPAGATAKIVKGADALIGGTKLAKTGAVLARSVGLGRTGAKLGAGLLEGGAKLASRAGVLGAEGAAVSVAQGADKNEVIRNAALSGAIPVVGAVLKGLKPLAGAAGKKIESSIIRATAKDIKDGFKLDSVFKYKLAGSLNDTAQKTHEAIVKRADELRSLLIGSEKRIDALSLIGDVEKSLKKNLIGNFGSNTKMQSKVDFLIDELGQLTKDGTLDLVEAQALKRSVGKLGAWQYGARDPDSTALEAVANEFYTALKKAIEKNTPKRLQAINRELSELIPIENAVIRRIPVAERASAINLTDLVSALPAFANPSNWWLFALNKLSKSGTVAQGLETLSRQPKVRGAVGTSVFGPPSPR